MYILHSFYQQKYFILDLLNVHKSIVFVLNVRFMKIKLSDGILRDMGHF